MQAGLPLCCWQTPEDRFFCNEAQIIIHYWQGLRRPKTTWKELMEAHVSWPHKKQHLEIRCKVCASYPRKGVNWCGWCPCTYKLIKNLIMIAVYKVRAAHLGLNARKPVLWGLPTIQAQTGLHIGAVWSAPLLFALWKVSYVNLPQVWSGCFWFWKQCRLRLVCLWGASRSNKIYTVSHQQDESI